MCFLCWLFEGKREESSTSPDLISLVGMCFFSNFHNLWTRFMIARVIIGAGNSSDVMKPGLTFTLQHNYVYFFYFVKHDCMMYGVTTTITIAVLSTVEVLVDEH